MDLTLINKDVEKSTPNSQRRHREMAAKKKTAKKKTAKRKPAKKATRKKATRKKK